MFPSSSGRGGPVVGPVAPAGNLIASRPEITRCVPSPGAVAPSRPPTPDAWIAGARRHQCPARVSWFGNEGPRSGTRTHVTGAQTITPAAIHQPGAPQSASHRQPPREGMPAEVLSVAAQQRAQNGSRAHEVADGDDLRADDDRPQDHGVIHATTPIPSACSRARSSNRNAAVQRTATAGGSSARCPSASIHASRT